MRAKFDKFDQVVSEAKARRRAFARKEDGSLMIFSLFMFILIIMMTGMAVDMMRHENERVAIQQTIDTAVLASSSLSQGATTNADVESLVKDYFEKAGYPRDMVSVAPNFSGPAGGTITGRSVVATADFQMNTMFMNLLGVDYLQGASTGAAREGQELIEIALVLDVSGSMRGDKLARLKTAAKEFVTFVIDANGADRVSISIVPYNQFVYVDDALKAELPWANTLVTVPDTEVLTVAGGVPHDGAITTYNTHNGASRCSVFSDADFDTRALTDSGEVVASAMYSEQGNSMDRPVDTAATLTSGPSNQFWCGTEYPKVLLYQNDETVLHGHIDSLTANGWTSIDYGMNWGVGILDPSFQPIVAALADPLVGVVPAELAAHPAPYNTPETLARGEAVVKYVVLMTDGINTQHNDLRTEFKSGPSRVWFSQEVADATGNDYAGYVVEMPDRPASQRWYVPNNPGNDADDEWLVGTPVLPDTYVQQSYHDLYARFRLDAAAEYFFQRYDPVAYATHLESNSEVDIGGYGTADTRTKAICDTAAVGDEIEVFTVAFDAPDAAKDLLAYCVTEAGNHFAVGPTGIGDAFAAIAASISQLKLTQ